MYLVFSTVPGTDLLKPLNFLKDESESNKGVAFGKYLVMRAGCQKN